jgi:hypothetical protein
MRLWFYFVPTWFLPLFLTLYRTLKRTLCCSLYDHVPVLCVRLNVRFRFVPILFIVLAFVLTLFANRFTDRFISHACR